MVGKRCSTRVPAYCGRWKREEAADTRFDSVVRKEKHGKSKGIKGERLFGTVVKRRKNRRRPDSCESRVETRTSFTGMHRLYDHLRVTARRCGVRFPASATATRTQSIFACVLFYRRIRYIFWKQGERSILARTLERWVLCSKLYPDGVASFRQASFGAWNQRRNMLERLRNETKHGRN